MNVKNPKLVKAVIKGDIDKVAGLLASGADANALDKDGVSALCWACHLGYTDIVRLLINHEADIDLQDSEGLHPIQVALYGAHFDICKILIDSGCDLFVNQSGFGLMHASASVGSMEIGELLFQKGVALDDIDDGGRTPLHWAVQEGYLDFCKFLLEHEVRIDAEDVNGFTPFQQSVGEGNCEIVNLLLENGADVNHVCGKHGTVLHTAFSYDMSEIIEILINAGVRFDVKDEDGRYPICYAVHNRHFDTVRKYVHIYKNILTAEEMQKLITMARRKGMHDISFE